MGVVFGAGWTPCIGPVLSGILTLATVSSTVWSGMLLMTAYCLGLGLPIVAVALGSAEVTRRFDWFARHHVAVSLVTGGLLVVVGFLMITNLFASLAGLIPVFGI
jgi:cytochrome c biogenesis protein transmembrane region